MWVAEAEVGIILVALAGLGDRDCRIVQALDHSCYIIDMRLDLHLKDLARLHAADCRDLAKQILLALCQKQIDPVGDRLSARPDRP